MRITVGHTPDSDDAFMFYGMLCGKIPSADFEIQHVIADIEELNKRALNHELDVTAVSAHACAYLPNYTILRSGGSFGIGYGPILVARQNITPEQLKKCKIAVPGKLTSAFLLLQLYLGKFNYTEIKFSEIPGAVNAGMVDAGLVIHETQLSYGQEGLTKIVDIGRWWHDHTGGLPVPLGVNVMSTKFEAQTIKKFDLFLYESIKYGLDHQDQALKYAMKYSRGKPADLVEKFVKMYVNDITLDMGPTGEAAIRRMFEMAKERKILPSFEPNIVR